MLKRPEGSIPTALILGVCQEAFEFRLNLPLASCVREAVKDFET